jgi:hypothetical protein
MLIILDLFVIIAEETQWIILVYLGSIVFADSLFAISLCVLRLRSRTGVKL